MRQTLAIYIAAALREFLSYPMWIISNLLTPSNEDGLGYSAMGKWEFDMEYWEKLTEFLKAQVAGNPTEIKVDLNYISPTEKEWRTILVKMLWAFEQVENNFEDESFPAPNEVREEYDKKIQEGLNLFAEHFKRLMDC